MPDTGSSRSPKLQKGALVQLTEAIVVPVPNIVPFQFNPETLSRGFTPWVAPETNQTGGNQESSDAQPFDPLETISIQELVFDASDGLEDDELTAKLFGVGERIAAVENMLFPKSSPFQTAVSAAVKLFSAGGSAPERGTVPVTLFVWGLGRIVPVRITKYTIEEQQFLPSLRPSRATISITMEVQDPSKLRGDSASQQIAKAAYVAFRAQQDVLAVTSNLTNADEVLAILPF